MILGQMLPYVRLQNQFTTGDWFGSQTASQDLTEAVLEHNVVESVHTFESHAMKEGVSDESLNEIENNFGSHRVIRHMAHHLPKLASLYDYVLVTHGLDFAQLGQIRLSLRGSRFPICALVHSIESPTMLLSYLTTHIYSESYDSIVVTSSAGMDAVRTLWDNASELLDLKLRPLTRSTPVFSKIPLGINTTFLSPRGKAESRHRLGLPSNQIIILYAGRLSEADKSDLDPLLLSFARLHYTFPNAHLMLAGQDNKGTYTAYLRQRIADINITEAVTLLPNFTYAIKPYIYSAADIFVSPADNLQETFGIALLEAMACGLPIVASDWSGYRDLVVEGKNGFLVPTYINPDHAWRASHWAPLADHTLVRHTLAQGTVVDPDYLYGRLHELILNKDLRCTLGANGRARALSQYSWAVVTEQLRALWQEQKREATSVRPSFFLQDYSRIFCAFTSALLTSGTEIHGRAVNNRQHINRYGAHVSNAMDLKPPLGQTHIPSDDIIWTWKKGAISHPDICNGEMEANFFRRARFRIFGSAVDCNEIFWMRNDIIMRILQNVLRGCNCCYERFLHLGAADGYITERIGARFVRNTAIEPVKRFADIASARPIPGLNILEHYGPSCSHTDKCDLILISPEWPVEGTWSTLLPLLLQDLSADGVMVIVNNSHRGSFSQALEMEKCKIMENAWPENTFQDGLDMCVDTADVFQQEVIIEVSFASIQDAFNGLQAHLNDSTGGVCASKKLPEFLSQHQQNQMCVLNEIYSFTLCSWAKENAQVGLI